ncbi:MAG TPA: hypothetical protein VGE29_16365 [Prosthecobacter sp.]
MSLITDTLIPVTRLVALALLSGCVLVAHGQPSQQQQQSRRTWTNYRGNSLKATFIGLGGNDVVLQLPNGALSTVLLSDLCQADQLYVQKLTGIPASVPAPASEAASAAGLVSYSPPDSSGPALKTAAHIAGVETQGTALTSPRPPGQWQPAPAAQLLLKEVRQAHSPWSFPGFETFMPQFALETAETVTVSTLQADLKEEIRAARARGSRPDMARLLACLNDAGSERPDGLSEQGLKDRQLDSLLLVYYFAFLDGKDSYTAVHEFCKSLLSSTKKEPAVHANLSRELTEELRAGRTDEQISAAMSVGFSALGIRL